MPYIHELPNLNELDLLPISPKTHIVYKSKLGDILIKVSNTSRRDSFFIDCRLRLIDAEAIEKVLRDKGFKIIHTEYSQSEESFITILGRGKL